MMNMQGKDSWGWTERRPLIIIACGLFIVMLGMGMARSEEASQELEFAKKLYDDGLYLLAADQYGQFVLKSPNSPLAAQARYMMAESYFAQGDMGKAEVAYREFLRENSRDPLASQAWFRLGLCLSRTGRLAEAVTAYSRCRQLDPQGPKASQALLEMAQAQRDQGDLPGALKVLGDFIQEYPQDPNAFQAHLALGEIMGSLGRHAEAAGAYGSAAQMATTPADNAKARYRQGKALAQGGDEQRAIDLLSSFAKEGATSVQADSVYFLLGDLYVAQGQYQEAAQTFGALAARPGVGDLAEVSGLRRAESLRLAGDANQSVGAYRQWLALFSQSPQMPQAQLGLAMALRARGNSDSAAVVLEELTRLEAREPWAPKAWLNLGEILRETGAAERALSVYRGFLSRYPQWSQADSIEFLSAEILEKDLHRPQAALRAYEAFSSTYPHSRWSARAAFNLGRIYQEGGEWSEALEAYQTFVQEHPLSALYPQAKEKIAYLKAFRVSEEPLALEAMVDIQDQLASGSLDAEEVDLRLADIYLRHLRNFDRAAAALERFLHKHPQSPRIDQAIFLLSECHGSQAKMSSFDGDLTEASHHQEASVQACRRLLREFPNSPWADRCALEVIAEVLRTSGLNAPAVWRDQVELYSSFLDTYPQSQQRGFALVRMAEAFVQLAPGDTSTLVRADSILALVASQRPASAWADTAAWRRLELAHQREPDDVVLERCRTFLQDFPSSDLRVQVLFLQAQILQQLGQHAQAASLYRSAAEDFPYGHLTEEARLRWAQSLAAAGEVQSAVSAVETFARLYPESSLALQARLLLVRYAAQSGDEKGARDLLSQLEAAASTGAWPPLLRLDLGDLYAELGLHHKAMRSYQKALETDTTHLLAGLAIEKMAQTSFQSGDYEAALGFYDQALIQISDEKRPLLEARRITSLYRLGHIAEASKARRSFQKAYGQDSTAVVALLMEEGLAYLEKKDGQAARKSFQAVIGDYPSSALAPQAQYQLALMALSAGDFQEALEKFRSLLEKYPQSDIKDAALFKMASALYGLEQYPDAARCYQQAADETRDQTIKVDAFYNAGICYAKMNYWDGAIDIYNRMMGEFRQHQDWHKWALRLGFAYLEAGQPAQALKTFQQVDPGGDDELGAEVQFWVGECYFKMGQYDRAAQEYLRVAFLYPGQDQWAVTSEYNAGISYEKLGRVEEARTIYRKLMRSRATGDQWAQMAQERLKALETEN